MWAALSRRIASRPRKVTEMKASRPSERRTDSTIRRTTCAGNGRRRPLTRTSLTLGRLEFRCEPAAGPRVADSLVVGAGHDSGEFALDSIQIAKGQRRVVQLARSDLLLHQMLDSAPYRFRRGIAQDPHCGLSRVGQHGHCGFCRLRSGTGIAKI